MAEPKIDLEYILEGLKKASAAKNKPLKLDFAKFRKEMTSATDASIRERVQADPADPVIGQLTRSLEVASAFYSFLEAEHETHPLTANELVDGILGSLIVLTLFSDSKALLGTTVAGMSTGQRTISRALMIALMVDKAKGTDPFED